MSCVLSPLEKRPKKYAAAEVIKNVVGHCGAANVFKNIVSSTPKNFHLLIYLTCAAPSASRKRLKKYADAEENKNVGLPVMPPPTF